jgi:hypothetical protein
MLLASGPTLLVVPLTTELHGRAWVAGAAVTFSVGCLLSSTAVDVVGRMRLPMALRWPLWGLGMLIGWIAAPLHAGSILIAQFLAGVCLTAFEGDMDARVAREAAPAGVTTALAYSASTRALGSAFAVRLLPFMVTASAIGVASSALVMVLGCTALAAWVITLIPRNTLRRVLPHPRTTAG